MTDENELRQARKRRLDDAVSAYMQQCMDDGHIPEGGVVVGWTIGIAHQRFDEQGREFDNFLIESSPGLNNFMARGIADTAAEYFSIQSVAPFEDDED